MSEATAVLPATENATEATAGRSKSYWEIVWYQLAQDRMAMAGLVVVIFLFSLALLAPIAASNHPFRLWTPDVPDYVPDVRSPGSCLAFGEPGGGYVSYPWVVGLLNADNLVDYAFNILLLSTPVALLAAIAGYILRRRKGAILLGLGAWAVFALVWGLIFRFSDLRPREESFGFREAMLREDARYAARDALVTEPALEGLIEGAEAADRRIVERARATAESLVVLSPDDRAAIQQALRDAASGMRSASDPTVRSLWEATSRLERALSRDPITIHEVRRRAVQWGRALAAAPRRAALVRRRMESFPVVAGLLDEVQAATEDLHGRFDSLAGILVGGEAAEGRGLVQAAMREASSRLDDAPRIRRTADQAVSAIFGPVGPIIAAHLRTLCFTLAEEGTGPEATRAPLAGGALTGLLDQSIAGRQRLLAAASALADRAHSSDEERAWLLGALDLLDGKAAEGSELRTLTGNVRAALRQDRTPQLRSALSEVGSFLTLTHQEAEPVVAALGGVPILADLVRAAAAGGDVGGEAARATDALAHAPSPDLQAALTAADPRLVPEGRGRSAVAVLRNVLTDLFGDRRLLASQLMELAGKLLGLGESDAEVAEARRAAREEATVLADLGSAIAQVREAIVRTSEEVGRALEGDPAERDVVRGQIDECAALAVQHAPILRSGIIQASRYLAWRPPTREEAVQQIQALTLAIAGPDRPRAVFPWVRFSPVEDQPGGHDFVEPCLAHPFGTDQLGRDLFSRMLYGARVSLTIGFVAVSLYVSIGIFVGAIAGYFGGWVDLLISRIIEVMMVFPTFFLILVLVALLKKHEYLREIPAIFIIMFVIGITSWTGVARLIRGEFLRSRNEDYVTAARALGLPQWRIIFRHVLPNAIAPALVSATFGIAGAILTESGLSFLGVGIEPPYPSWGLLLKDARTHLFRLVEDFSNLEPLWMSLIPGIAIFITLTAFNIFGEGLRDALDPKLRKA